MFLLVNGLKLERSKEPDIKGNLIIQACGPNFGSLVLTMQEHSHIMIRFFSNFFNQIF